MQKMVRKIISSKLQFSLFFAAILLAIPAVAQSDLKAALNAQEGRSILYLINNISHPGAAKGSVIASPSRSMPDCFYHWVRDAALTMDVVFQMYLFERDSAVKNRYMQTLKDYVAFSRRTQLAQTAADLGEPKFHVDGSPFTGPWGRPQNDGPAIRAYALSHLAQVLLDQGDSAYVRNHLYDSQLPATTVIKADLEYVAHHWRKPSFDLWEETSGDHFYNRMVQRRAMIDGAALAARLGDQQASKFYLEQSKLIAKELEKHWDSNAGILRATLNRNGGIDYKSSGLDVAVVLGSLHGSVNDGFFAPTDSRVLATAQKIEEAFKKIYGVNAQSNDGVAIGRYPEDRYDGAGFSGGNPWFLCTHALAELYSRAVNQFAREGKIKITNENRNFFSSLKLGKGVDAQSTEFLAGSQGFNEIMSVLRGKADGFLRVSLRHMKQDTGSMAEQFNRDTGFMQGAHDLTWSYASFLTAKWNWKN